MHQSRKSHTKRQKKALITSIFTFLSLTLINGQDKTTPKLTGVGFTESSTSNGLNTLSMAGGAEIMIYGLRMEPMPSDSNVNFYDYATQTSFPGPALSANNEFKSNPSDGKLEYTTPSLSTILSQTPDQFASLEWKTFELKVKSSDAKGGNVISCNSWQIQPCQLSFSRAYTPILYELNPPVGYYGSNISFSIDPKSAQNLKTASDPPFIEGRMGTFLVNFEDTVDESLTLSGYAKNQVIGVVGDVDPTKDLQPSMTFKAGFAQTQDRYMTHCNFDSSDCYKVKSVPSIYSVNSNQGYTTGGQILNIKGYGFTNDVTVKVDGVDCAVQSYTRTSVTCQTGSAANPSSTTSQPGAHGLRGKIYNSTSGYSLTSFTTLSYYEQLFLTAESLQNQGTYFGRLLTGYFKAPATTNYLFYLSCDDSCELWLGTSQDPSTKTKIVSLAKYTAWRDFLSSPNQVSTSQALVAGQYYYLEVRHLQASGGEAVSVAVEIENSVAGHINSKKQVQRLQINPVNVREKTTITITNPGTGSFNVYAQDVSNKKYGPYIIPAAATANQVYNALYPYYSAQGAGITVTLEMTDASGAVTTTASQSVKNVYTILFQKATSTLTLSKFLPAAVGTTATFSYTAPSSSPSSAPLSGSFTITCSNGDGTTNNTVEMPYSTYVGTISQNIVTACPLLRDKFELYDGSTYNYAVDGRDLFIRFTGIIGDMPQFSIQSGTSTVLQGNSITYSNTIYAPASTNIFYAPIPYDLLYTDELTPSITLTANGLQATCPSLACGYVYQAAPSQIISFSVSGNTLSISGTSLPTTISDISFGFSTCAINSNSDSAISCTLNSPLVSGSWLPLVREANGFVPVSSSASSQIVGVSATSVTPNSNLNPNGGTILTISGSNFPKSLNEGTYSVVFADATKCTVLSTSSSQITCKTNKFSVASTQQITITINGQTSNSLSVTVASSSVAVTSIQPLTYSPVLKTLITLTLTSYSGTITLSDFTLTLVSTTDATKVIPVNVVAVDDSAKTVTAKYGGAEAGSYYVKLNSVAYGDFDTSAFTFSASGVITSITPTTGSLYGGTLVTITGHTFSTDATDNPISIGSTPCDVITSTATEITCRTQARLSGTTDGTDDVIVFLKTYAEADCTASVCKFTWTDSVPVLDSFTTAFNTATNQYEVTFTGSNFDGDINSVALFVDGNKQPVTSVSSTQVVATLTNINGLTTTNVNLYLQSGVPSGSGQLSSTGLSLTPQLVSLTPTMGSACGSVIIANIQGVGVNTKNLQLVTSSGTNICSSVTILSYGVVQCTTSAAAYTSAVQISVKVGSTAYTCANTDTTQCQWSTNPSGPSVSGVSLSGDSTTLTFTGVFFPTSSSYTPEVKYSGIKADSVTVTSDTQVVATFNNGLPISATAIVPTLFFGITAVKTGDFACNTQTVTNSLTIVSSSSVQCSFAGGCALQVTTNGGLTTSILQNQAAITVCGLPCTLDAANSGQSATTCKVPSLPTVYSVNNYEISSTSSLTGATSFASNSSGLWSVNDGNNMSPYLDTASTCYFGVGFKQNFVGIVNQVKFFMTPFTKATFSGNLLFQGSQDGVAYTTLFTVRDEIHEGWNYYVRDQGQEYTYRFYRFYSATKGACYIGEYKLIGYEAINNNDPTYSCSASLTVGSTAFALSSTTVQYKNILTPTLSSISPRFGPVTGNTLVTFTGTNFPTDGSLVNILIDNRLCAVQSSIATQVICKTSDRPGLFPDTSLQFNINGFGNVATKGLLFRYVSFWSDTTTWGGDFAPITGDTVYIPPGLSLLVDVDSTPVLKLVLVEGSLIFPPDANPNHIRTFDATYIMIQGGYMEVGTEEFPYTSELIITMHGEKTTPEMPIYGNKVIGVNMGTLDIHGIPRSPTWTVLAQTANAGDTQIVMNQAVDWKVGETIVVASTGYDCFEAEKVQIASVDRTDADKPVITLSRALLHKHYAGVEQYGLDELEMRGEVGLLTRNVKYRGDVETSPKNQFGAHIMMHSHGDESLTGRIEYVEFYNVGQAFQLGRYPIHYHLIGTVSNSYVRGNAIYDTFNRAVTIHAVQYLRVVQNVAFNTMGHTFFIEDAIETNNFLDGNLAIQTKRSWSLLNTDQTPASFWITNPNNIFRNNHAAGSERYGFWFDLQPNPTGPSFTPTICPINTQLGEFTNNTAHSNGRYGLRIFHGHSPRQSSCDPVVYDSDNTADPFWKNPLVTATYSNFLGYKNQISGAITEKMGDVRFINFKVADNAESGIEWGTTDESADMKAQVNGALIVGRSANDEDFDGAPEIRYGLVTPRSENFTVTNVKFHNFDQDGDRAIGTCSHCPHPASTDSGARTVTFQQLTFAPTVAKRIGYQFPFRDILKDLDGTLTGLGPNTWATPYWPHNAAQPECQTNLEIYDGLICDNTVEVRRIVFDGYTDSIFNTMEMKILPYDDDVILPMTYNQWDTYVNDSTKYSIVPWTKMKLPNNAWAVPYVTKHKYKIHWRYGLDFMQMRFTLSERWRKTDHNIELLFNFTDIRAKIDFVTPDGNATNGTLLTVSPSLLATADNVVWNETSNRTFLVNVNGKNSKRNPVTMIGYRCIGSCLTAIEEVPVETDVRYWSNITSWGTLGRLPLENEDVEILSGWNMVLDLPKTPVLKLLTINGRLSFLDDGVTNITLQAKQIFVRAGQFLIGNETKPFSAFANIILYGFKNESAIVYTNAIQAGNKLIANTANMKFFGQKRDQFTRLTQTANPTDQKIYVEKDLDWKAGDRIGLFPTNLAFNNSDMAYITSYDPATGLIQLDRKLTGMHYGAAQSTASVYNGVDIRGEVFLLSRNIKIQGQDIQSWGGQVVTSDFIEADGTERNGHTIFDHVEVYNCSQFDTKMAALRFDGASQAWSSITNSAIYMGNGWGLHMMSSANILFQNNVVFGFINIAVNLNLNQNITLDGNLIGHVRIRDVILIDEAVDPQVGLAICASIGGDPCKDHFITNNIIAGVPMFGVATPGHSCNTATTDRSFWGNIVHSINGAAVEVYPIPGNTEHAICYEGSNFAVYKSNDVGVTSYYKTKRVQFSNLTLIDNRFSYGPNIGLEGDQLQIHLKNSIIFGETPSPDCFFQNQCKWDKANTGCFEKRGVMMPQFDQTSKSVFPDMSSNFPIWKIKHEASWGGEATINNVIFSNFSTGTTFCGMSQSVFTTNIESADYHPRLTVSNSYFNNVNQTAVANMNSPQLGWANIDDCGIFPCTGPKNAFIDFQGMSYIGKSPYNTKSNFQIIANNPGVANAISTPGVANAISTGCKLYSEWNGYYCENENIGIMLFESVDTDFKKRTFSPMVIYNNKTKFNNTLNEFMDHTWDGFYTGQIRQSRFPTLVETGFQYNVSYTGTPPGNQRFKLIATNGGTLIHIQYPKAGAYKITDVNSNTIQGNAWDDSVKNVGIIKGTKCGENRYLGVDNILEFYLTPSCLINIVPIDQLLTRVRLNWTLDAFYAEGGATKFVDRLASSLGISPQTIKVVSVYQGSVQVVFQIVNLFNTTNYVQDTKAKLITQIKAGTLNLGAPILEYQQNFGSIITVTSSSSSTVKTNTTNTSTSTSNVAVIVDSNGKTIVIVQNTNTTNTTNSGKTSTSGSVSKGSNLLKILLATIIVFVVFVVTLVVGFLLYKRYLNKKMSNQTQLASDSPDEKKGKKNMDDIETYKVSDKSQDRSGNVFTNIFKRRSSQMNSHQSDVIVENVESQNEIDPQEQENKHSFHSYSQVSQNFNQSNLEQRDLISGNQIIDNQQLSGTQKSMLTNRQKNAQVHSELSIHSESVNTMQNAFPNQLISPSKHSFIHNQDFDSEVKIKTPEQKEQSKSATFNYQRKQ